MSEKIEIQAELAERKNGLVTIVHASSLIPWKATRENCTGGELLDSTVDSSENIHGYCGGCGQFIIALKEIII
jgi:hypothetical protein